MNLEEFASQMRRVGWSLDAERYESLVKYMQQSLADWKHINGVED